MSPISLDELVDRMRIRADVAADLALEAANGCNTSYPSGLGPEFWQHVHRETAIVFAVLAGAPPEDALQYAERAALLLALREKVTRNDTERAALQVVSHELRLDLRCLSSGVRQSTPLRNSLSAENSLDWLQ